MHFGVKWCSALGAGHASVAARRDVAGEPAPQDGSGVGQRGGPLDAADHNSAHGGSGGEALGAARGVVHNREATRGGEESSETLTRFGARDRLPVV